MAKKRKVSNVSSQTTTISAYKDSPTNEESSNPLLMEPNQEGLSAPVAGEASTEPPFTEEDPNHQPTETASGDENTISANDPECDEDSDPAFLQKLLEPFSKDQVVDILRQATLKHPDLWPSIRQIADVDPAHRKVFVHGLGWNTTAETLNDAFCQFGEIEDCNAIVDKITGRSKGYGFIVFKHRSGARRALKEPQKKIGNKMTACQLASAGPPHITYPISAVVSTPSVFPLPSEYTQRKIYVSNVGSNLDSQKLLQFFSKFGEIEEGPLGLDKASGKPKGFCLFIYKDVESAKKALQEPHKNFEGHILHCQKAIDGPKFGKQGLHGGQYGSLQQGKSGFGHIVPQFEKNVCTAQIGGMPSLVTGPGHLIAPPAQSVRFNQTNQLNAKRYNPILGMPANNGGFMGNMTFSNQVGGTGSYIRPSVTLQIHGGYNNTALGQGSAWAQHGFSHAGGVGSSTSN